MKKSFITTILLLLATLSGFSQSDTLVKIPKSQAIRAVQDLIRYDHLQELVPILEREIQLYDQILVEKDTVISKQYATIENLNQILNATEEVNEKIHINLGKEIKKQKTLKIIAIAAGVVTGALFILK